MIGNTKELDKPQIARQKSKNSPARIRTVVAGFRAPHAWPLHHWASDKIREIICEI